jgi:predicted RNA-binding Zn-ribbon protein involved in translation (DUF1610 family)
MRKLHPACSNTKLLLKTSRSKKQKQQHSARAVQRIGLPHSVIVRAPGLLPMLYTVAELAAAIGIADRTLRDWLAHGAPHLRDAKGRVWVNGREFAAWVERMRKPARKRKLQDGQAYCVSCRKAVKLLNPETHHVRGKLTNTKGICPECGHTINRGGRLASNPKPAYPRKGTRA